MVPHWFSCAPLPQCASMMHVGRGTPKMSGISKQQLAGPHAGLHTGSDAGATEVLICSGALAAGPPVSDGSMAHPASSSSVASIAPASPILVIFASLCSPVGGTLLVPVRQALLRFGYFTRPLGTEPELGPERTPSS